MEPNSYKFLKRLNSAWVSYSIATTDNWRDMASAMDVRSASDIDIYIVRKGTTDLSGGNIEKWTSSNGGVSFVLNSLIKEGRFIDPAIVRNYHTNGKLLFFEYAGDATTWTRKGYLWGVSGFIKNSLITDVPEIKNLYKGTLNNSPALVAGKFGNCYSFVGSSSQYIEIPDNNIFSFAGGSPDKPFTLSLWLNVSTTAGTVVILGKGSAFEYMFYVLSFCFFSPLYIIS